jgi:hypothetical protein
MGCSVQDIMNNTVLGFVFGIAMIFNGVSSGKPQLCIEGSTDFVMPNNAVSGSRICEIYLHFVDSEFGTSVTTPSPPHMPWENRRSVTRPMLATTTSSTTPRTRTQIRGPITAVHTVPRTRRGLQRRRPRPRDPRRLRHRQLPRLRLLQQPRRPPQRRQRPSFPGCP